MDKRFGEWVQYKEKLHYIKKGSPLIREGDLWWLSIGENIGSEINGKSHLFSRPGVILKRLSYRLYLIAPTTSQKREGSWYAQIMQEKRHVSICLHQIRVIDYRRLSNRLGKLDSNDFEKVKEIFLNLYK
jgi:mRNA interferase MazF